MTRTVNTKPVELRNNSLTVKVWPEAGGRVVWLGLNGRENLIEFDENIFSMGSMEIPAANEKSDFMTLNGHTVWVGPQSTWWTDQHFNTQRCEKRIPWPPDPYLYYGSYTVHGNLNNEVLLKSPDSPITGIKLEKTIFLTDTNVVLFSVKATNIRNAVVSRDLWLNTRFKGWSRAFVPVADSADVIVDKGTIPYQIKEGFFSYLPQETTGKIGNSKAFIYPSKPVIAGFTGNQLLLIEFEPHPRESIHPEQALVEIYNHTNLDDRKDALLELEYHAPFYHLKPGETMETWERWTVLPYEGNDSDSARIAFLKQLGF